MFSSNASQVSTGAVTYIEDVFSTYLYNGNSAGLTINNGIDLAGKGGMVWGKTRNAANKHVLFDTVRGPLNELSSNLTAAQENHAQSLTAFTSTGYTLGNDDWTSYSNTFQSASWTFRKQPKFFDVVTYTGASGNTVQNIAHNLGSVPGTIIIKATSTAGYDWIVYHRSLGATKYAYLNQTAAADTFSGYWNNTEPTSTQFTVGTSAGVNSDGTTYVAYLFAHNAGGFGLSGNENVVSCGSFTTDGSGNATVNLGYEPQYILMKKTNSAQNWVIYDTMRGWAQMQQAQLYANITQTEDMYLGSPYFFPTAAGFTLSGTFGLGNNGTFAYIAIRRGPMKVPTDGTKVYNAEMRSGNDTQTNVTNVGFSPDIWMVKSRNVAADFAWFDRLRGVTKWLATNQANRDETFSGSNGLVSINMNGITIGSGALDGGICNDTGKNYANYFFRRAPSFFDEVILNNSTTTYTHNLTVSPELIFVKCRDVSGANWVVYSKSLSSSTTEYLNLNNTNSTQPYGAGAWSVSPTQFSVDIGLWANGSTGVAYLFATAPGVSKVGTYTGTGTTQAINCGFTAGARFVMIKRTDAAGAWYVWDTARGIGVSNDPYIRMNTNAAEVTDDDSISVNAIGFQLSQNATADVNASGGSYIFLAVA